MVSGAAVSGHWCTIFPRAGGAGAWGSGLVSPHSKLFICIPLTTMENEQVKKRAAFSQMIMRVMYICMNSSNDELLSIVNSNRMLEVCGSTYSRVFWMA